MARFEDSAGVRQNHIAFNELRKQYCVDAGAGPVDPAQTIREGPDATQSRLTESPSQQYAGTGKRLGQVLGRVGEPQLRMGFDCRETRHLLGTGGTLNDDDGSSAHAGLNPPRKARETELSQLLHARWRRRRYCENVFVDATLQPPHSSPVSSQLDSSDAAPTHALLVDTEQHSQGSVYRLTVVRPERLNIVDTATLTEMSNALARIAADDSARAVILGGAGDKAWIGGANINQMVALDSSSARAFITRLHQVCQALRQLPVPVIALVDGFCLGAGLEHITDFEKIAFVSDVDWIKI